jgi:hypothetical protein
MWYCCSDGWGPGRPVQPDTCQEQSVTAAGPGPGRPRSRCRLRSRALPLPGVATRENPCQASVKVSEDPYPFFSGILTKHFEHSGEAICDVLHYIHRRARARPKHGTLRQFANIVRGDFYLRDVRVVEQLRITGVEVGVSENLVLVRKRRGQIENTGGGAQNHPVFFDGISSERVSPLPLPLRKTLSPLARQLRCRKRCRAW